MHLKGPESDYGNGDKQRLTNDKLATYIISDDNEKRDLEANEYAVFQAGG